MSVEGRRLEGELPLFQLRDFDILLNQSWPVGVDSDYPSELRVRLSAASLSFNAGNQSIDYFRRHYLNDLVYEEAPRNRLDKRIALFLSQDLERLEKALDPLAPENGSLGQMVSKWTFLRTPFSFRLAVTCAQRGALFECLAIVRMILEQMAWALDVRNLDDRDAIVSRRATQSINTLKLVHPAAGPFYGWLSAHAHWTYDAHIKGFHATKDKIGMLLANSLYKAQSLGAILVLLAIADAAYDCLRVSLGSTAKAESNASIVSILIRELKALAPDDQDLQHLLKLIEIKHPEG
jgi:hypothetical protein